jgi:hypothetical protein
MFDFRITIEKRGNYWHVTIQVTGAVVRFKYPTWVLVQMIAILMSTLQIVIPAGNLNPVEQPPAESTCSDSKQIIIDQPKDVGAAAPDLHER